MLPSFALGLPGSPYHIKSAGDDQQVKQPLPEGASLPPSAPSGTVATTAAMPQQPASTTTGLLPPLGSGAAAAGASDATVTYPSDPPLQLVTQADPETQSAVSFVPGCELGE